MARRRILWKLYPSYLFIIFLAVVAVAWYGTQLQAERHLEQVAEDLKARAELVAVQVEPMLSGGDTLGLDSLVKVMGEKSQTRITIILSDGLVISDSENDPARMENHSKRPEIMAAYDEGLGSSTRFSSTMGQSMMYVALRVNDISAGTFIVRTSVPVTYVQQTLNATRLRMALIGLLVAVLAGVVSWIVSRRLSWPLEQLRLGAQRFADGDLSQKLPVSESSEEIGALSEAMNDMALQLYRRINMISQQRQEQEAILTSMIEGVLAVDPEMRIISYNKAAARMMNIHHEGGQGKTLQEIIRNTTLHNLLNETLRTNQANQAEVVLSGPPKLYIQASATVLYGADEENLGALVVLNDVTRLRKLENIRREFVGNVSHELKTPITSIKGFVETLMDGAVDNPDDARRFLEIIARHTDRLAAIIEDLLSLSRIEQGAERSEIELRGGALESVLESARQGCEALAAAKNIVLRIDIASDLVARINAPLLEQAVINLINNAITYSETGQEVLIKGFKTSESMDIQVIDHGKGIEPEYLPRLFERFYRVDRARSREMGGTGLGLAIVKHIVLAHGGKVSVDSKPGSGSQFTIQLPL